MTGPASPSRAAMPRAGLPIGELSPAGLPPAAPPAANLPMNAGALMPIGRLLRAYAVEARYELLRMLRSPAFSMPFLLMPVPIYLFFAVVMAGPEVAKQPSLANYLFSGFSTFAIMGPALFGVGCTLAIERETGILRLKRAQPAPGGAYLLAKMAVAMMFAALAMSTLLVAAAVAGSTSLTAGQLAAIALVMIAGAIPFAAIGLCVGAYTSGSAAPAFANLIFLPMLYLSGLFIPLPAGLKSWVIIWPAFHVNQVALAAAGVSDFVFVPPALAVGVLAGVTVICGGVAIHRLARRG